MKIMVINGPNLNMLGMREPGIYGTQTLDDVNQMIKSKADELGLEVEFFQSNCEGEIVSKIHQLRNSCDGLIINAGAYTHYSYAIADALPIANIPTVEVHMSNVAAREEFRHHSVISSVCTGTICGFGADSYILALNALHGILCGKGGNS